MEKIGLVLEGGGMRCVFTAGVLDYFMEHNITFPYVVGVSAGACAETAFLSHQPTRQKQCLIDLYEKYHYISLKNWITKKSVIDMDLLFDKFSFEILPFDFKSYFENPTEAEMVTSNCLTGEANYLNEHKDEHRLAQICKASSSIPYVCQTTYVDGIPMLDGGICDPIPFQRALDKGCTRTVIVLTRNHGRRSPYTNMPIPPFIYHKYPEIRHKMSVRGNLYNEQMKTIESMQKSGQALVIQPQKRLKVTSVERSIKKLKTLYQEGYDCAKAIHEFLAKNQ